MKRIFFICFFCLPIICFAGITKEKYKEIKKSLPSGMNADWDKFEDIVWVTSDELSSLTNIGLLTSNNIYFKFSFGIKGDGSKTPMHLKIRYVGSNWVFGDEVVFISGLRKEIKDGGGQKFRFTLESTDKRVVAGVSGTLNSGTSVVEFAEAIDLGLIDFINSQTAENTWFIFRFSSKYKAAEGTHGDLWGSKTSKYFKEIYSAYNQF